MLRKIFQAPVRFYQKFISPLTPSSCRFTPSCSQYCIDAIEEWGVVAGLVLALWRILRCNPWSKGGSDPVPPCAIRRKLKAKLEARKNRHKNK